MKWIIVFALLASPAVAAPHQGCNAVQSLLVDNALVGAKRLSTAAAAKVGDTEEYARWFGKYSDRNAEQVRATMKGIVSAIRTGAVTVQCDVVSDDDGCEPGTYAWVMGGAAYHMHICPPFFNQPTMASLDPDSARSDNGTREGTLIHELSHFARIAGTDDHCYSREDCAEMAIDDPARARDNADSYQYFTEDVTHFAKRPPE